MGTRHLSSWPPSLPLELTPPKTSIWVNLETTAARVPDRRAIVFYDTAIAYARLKRETEHLAGFLQRECGVKRGDRVALYMQNSPQFIIAFYAILRADAVVVPVNPMNLAGEIEYMLRDSGATVMFASQEIAHNATPLLDGKPLHHLIVSAYSDYLEVPTDLPIPEFVSAPRKPLDVSGVTPWSDAMALGVEPGPHTATPDDLCVLPYTSGTTGNPKGCMHSHRTVMHTTVAGPTWYGAPIDDECDPLRPAALPRDRDAERNEHPHLHGRHDRHPAALGSHGRSAAHRAVSRHRVVRRPRDGGRPAFRPTTIATTSRACASWAAAGPPCPRPSHRS